MTQFSNILIAWYHENKRDLPWRNTKDPYFIWLSEIILQQTRVNQGMDYYLKFANEFPAVKDLAKADNEKVMKLWQGLGYYSRARNLHATAKIITDNYNGTFPDDYNEILKLKGVGEYTAAAIASFAFNKAHAVVDGNVYRVLSRVFGISTPIDSSLGKKEFSQLANELIDKKNPATHNQSIMEFGALQCKPGIPDCPICPLNSMCYAFSKKEVDQFPIKSKKIKVRNRYFNYIVLKHKGNVAIKKRTEKDIWINLYDFPLIECTKLVSKDEFLKSTDWTSFIKKLSYTINGTPSEFIHVLSHQKIHARFWEIECKQSFTSLLPKNNLIIKNKDIHQYAVSRLIENFLEQ